MQVSPPIRPLPGFHHWWMCIQVYQGEVHAVRNWPQPSKSCNDFQISTGNSSPTLAWLPLPSLLNVCHLCQARRALLFTRFDLKVNYCPGDKNTKEHHRLWDPVIQVTSKPSRFSVNATGGQVWPKPTNASFKDISKTQRHLPEGKLHPVPNPYQPWSRLGIDFGESSPTCLCLMKTSNLIRWDIIGSNGGGCGSFVKDGVAFREIILDTQSECVVVLIEVVTVLFC